MPPIYFLRQGDEDQRPLAAVLDKLAEFECRVRTIRGDATGDLADVPDQAVVLTYLRDETMTDVVTLVHRVP